MARNNQLAFDLAEREFGIQPMTTGKEMEAGSEPDKLLMVLYLSKFFETFRNSSLNNGQSSSLLLLFFCALFLWSHVDNVSVVM